MKKRPTPKRVQLVQQLRRSNAAQPIKNKTKYTRKVKHKLIMNGEL